MKTGKEVLKEIDAVIRTSQERIRDQEDRIGKINTGIHGTQEMLLGAYSELAKYFFPEISIESSQNASGLGFEDVEELYRRKQGEISSLVEDQESVRKNISGLERKLAELDSQIDTTQGEIEGVVSNITDELTRIEGYSVKRKEAEKLSNRVSKDAQTLSDFEAECEDKRAAFERNPIFMYLWNKGFDEATAPETFLGLDLWAASLIGYGEQSQNYRFLVQMPLEMRDYLGRTNDNLDELVNELDIIEREVETRHRLPESEGRLNSQENSRNNLEDIINKKQRRFEADSDRLNILRKDDNGEYWRRGIQLIEEQLGRESISKLYRRARKTRSTVDDQLVAQIEEYRTTIEEAQREIRVESARLDGLRNAHKRITKLQKKFRRSNYDSTRSRIHLDSTDSLINGLYSGELSERHVWSQIDDNYKLKPRPQSSYSSSSLSSGTGFGGGGFSSGGGFGGGGFSSGGGF